MKQEKWRYTCARCGSVSVAKNKHLETGWTCHACKRNTPAVWDKKKERWIHEPQMGHRVTR